ncbi:RNA-directed DNA polymerase, eukaryota [Tanacetum coccineum]|uniref:RNA-directed DNA polymerase, eukaryota n=1 Tax=Tanacetum coccineum TaxID=301880 RepID=A0ABQ5FVB6_9ASTR
MGNNDWQEVTRKNHRSVFQRLNCTGVRGSYSQRPKEDHVTQISKSVFVTNFPENFESSDLWKICEGYGKVVDVYIPNRKSKAGKQFAFVHFIRVEDIDWLIRNLCTIWIGRFHLHANVVRYERPRKPSNTAGHVYVNKHAPSGSYASVAKGNTQLKPLVFQASTVPALVLDDSCVIEHDLSRHVMGRVKQLNSIPNLQTILSKEGFPEVKLTYLGGLWVMIELNNEVTKQNLLQHIGVNSWFHVLHAAKQDFIGAKWGEAMDFEENLDSLFARKRLYIKTKQEDNILEKFKVILKGKVFLVRAKELFAWTPTFLDCKESKYNSDNESCHGEEHKPVGSQDGVHDLDDDSDVKGVSETMFGDKPSSPNNSCCSRNEKEVEQRSEDPFNLYDLLKQNPKGAALDSVSSFLIILLVLPRWLRFKQENNKQGYEKQQVVAWTTCIKRGICSLFYLINLKRSSILEVLDNMIQTKKEWVKELNIKHKVDFLALQETKMNRVTQMDVKFIWGNSNYQYVSSDSVASSSKTSSLGLYFDFIARWNGETIVMGDFNEVRSKDERLGLIFNHSSSRIFNQFITSSGLVDVNLEGYSFTWSHPSASKMSKLDRFLVSEGIISLFPSITALCLDRHLSDHRPILLRELITDYRPTPFRFYHSWFKWDDFDVMVEHAWNSLSHSDANGLIRFKKKLQDLKKIIRSWVKDKKLQQAGVINSIKSKLIDIDKTLDRGNVSDEILFKRMEMVQQLHDVKQMETRDDIQKSKIKWAIEGDENSKFFHGIINKKRSQMSIRGIFVDGDWKTDPGAVKDAFKDHFAERFKQPVNGRLKLNIQFNNRLSTEQVADLDRGVSRDEIRSSVWDCGENKSPGLDGYTFEFFRRYWRFVGPDFCSVVECFFDNGSFPMGSNSSFIALIPKVMDAKFVTDFRPISLIGCVYKVITKILAKRLVTVISDLVSDSQSAFVANRQILDGPFILNELLAWCKRKKKQAMIFKVDFAKAYDSVRWDYLLDVLHAFGFGPNWCRWIRGTFSSSIASILVNGSPTSEFPFFCGLKQGDPLAPFLFILIIESLHIYFSRAINDGFFKGIQIDGTTSISHLFYADDVVFIGEWSDSNMKSIVTILKPFRYLGVMIGDCMSQKHAWDETIQKLHARLSNWKVKTLSIGGRLTLLKSVLGASPLYNMLIYKVPKGVLNEMEAIRNGSLWYRIIQALYDHSFELHAVGYSSLWSSILREIHVLKSKGFDFLSHCKKRGGDGHNTWFWYDKWLSDQPFYVMFPRLFALEMDKEISVASKMGSTSLEVSFRIPVRDGVERQQLIDLNLITGSILLSSSKDRRICDLSGDGEFRVKVARTKLDDIFLPSDSIDTRWVKYIPIKINVFAWRVRLDRLPTRVNLLRRGVVLESSLCPMYGLLPEDIQHVIFRCDIAQAIFRKICRWWDLDWHDLFSFSDWFAWFSAIRLSASLKLLL